VPVLARLFERAGLATVTVTMMPGLAHQLGTPRVVGVEFPFGHPFGRPGDVATQTAVLRAALQLLTEATSPNAVVSLPFTWPEPQEVAYKAWQPREMSPIVRYMREQVLARRRAEEGNPA
jgi:hypothetical protein